MDTVSIIDDEMIASNVLSIYQAGCILAMESRVEAILMNVNGTDIFRKGLPFARFDALVISGRRIRSIEKNNRALHELSDILARACDGKII